MHEWEHHTKYSTFTLVNISLLCSLLGDVSRMLHESEVKRELIRIYICINSVENSENSHILKKCNG